MDNKKQSRFSTEEERTEALRLSIAGVPIREIAKKLKRRFETVAGWSTKYNWQKEKKEAQAKSRNNIFNKYRIKVEEICSKALDGTRLIVHMSVQELDHIQQQHPKAGRKKEVRNEIESWGKILKMGTDMQKNIIPEANQELSELIHKELKKINERYEKEVKISEPGKI